MYESIACIEFQGRVTLDGESTGHYVCDVKCSSDRKWYRTNDNNDPRAITVDEVSKVAYVILYKRKN